MTDSPHPQEPDFAAEVSGYENGELDLAAYVRLFWEHRWWIAGVTAAAVIVGALHAFLATPVYTARTVLFLDRGAQTAQKDLPAGPSSDLSTEIYFSSQPDIMRSKEVARAAFEALGLKDHPAFQGEAHPVDKFRKMISVQRERNSALFTVSVSAPYQKEVAAWANAVARAYSDVTLRQKLQFLAEANKVMTEQVDKMEQEYARVKERYGDYLASTGSYFPQNQQAILDSSIQDLEQRRSQVLIQKNTTQAKLSQLRTLQTGDQDPLTLAAIQDDPQIQDLARQYNQAEKDCAQLLTQFTPKYPGVIKKREELSSLKQRIRDQALYILKGEESEYATLTQEYGALTAELDQLKMKAIASTQGSSQNESLQAGVQAIHKYMDLLTDKIREVNVAASLTSNAIRVVDRAETPRSPSKPNKRMELLLSLLLGMMVSMGSVVAVQYLDTRVKSPGDLEKALHLPILGAIPLHTEEGRTLVVEAFQTLRTSLIYSSDHRVRNVISVTSPSAGEGKSTIVADLGITLASGGDRVLLLDCDVRKPTQHRFFKVSNEGGLAAFLASDEESPAAFVAPTDKDNLFLLPAGKATPNPPSLFSMEKFHRLLQTVKGQYDWVLIDTPPALAVTDAGIIAGEADYRLIVALSGATQRPALLETAKQFAGLGRPLDGAVLNRFEWSKHYYYRHYYRKHYQYYYHGEPPKTGWEKAWARARHLMPSRAPKVPSSPRPRL